MFSGHSIVAWLRWLWGPGMTAWTRRRPLWHTNQIIQSIAYNKNTWTLPCVNCWGPTRATTFQIMIISLSPSTPSTYGSAAVRHWTRAISPLTASALLTYLFHQFWVPRTPRHFSWVDQYSKLPRELHSWNSLIDCVCSCLSGQTKASSYQIWVGP